MTRPSLLETILLDGAPFCVTMRPTSPPWIPVGCPVHWLRPALCPRDRSTGAPKTCLYQRHTTSDRGMDCTPGQRHSLAGPASVAAERTQGLAQRLSRTLELGRHPRRVHHTLYVAMRASGREEAPTAAAIDSLGAKGPSTKGGLGSSCGDGRDDCFHSSNALLMADMPETRCARRLRTHGGCASSSVSMLPASRSCPNAGIVEQTFCVDQPQSPLGS